MPCCFVPAFQGKEWSENTKRKVSTALFLHGDFFFFFYKGDNKDLGFDQSPVSLNKQTLTRSRLPVSTFLTFCLFDFVFCFLFYNLILLHRRLKDFVTCIQMHKTLHFDIISWTSQLYIRLACNSPVINMGNTRFRWISDTWWGRCSLHLPIIPLLPFFFLSLLYIPIFSFLFPFHVYIMPNSVCSFYWLLWNR